MLVASSPQAQSFQPLPPPSVSVLLIDACCVSRRILLHSIASRDSGIKIHCTPRLLKKTNKNFNLVILNVHTFGGDELELIPQLLLIKNIYIGAPILVIVKVKHDYFSAGLLRLLEIRGYIMHLLNPAILAVAIRLICAGGSYQPVPRTALSRDCVVAKVKTSLPMCSSPAYFRLPLSSEPEFTTRETDVLRLLQQAKPNKIIAYELSISVNTAKVHVRNIMRKLRATNRTQVVIDVPPQNWNFMQ